MVSKLPFLKFQSWRCQKLGLFIKVILIGNSWYSFSFYTSSKVLVLFQDDVVQEILEAKQAKAEAAKMGSSSSLNSAGSEEEEEEEKVVKPEEMEE